ncbi:site-specific DNA-methyltransferase [Methyloligella solikamskensis]|uniref:Methyltransferase n=1 Tax=Methyloligella solikamskensis TaxID=1177756 RepID=A0ABW3JAU7_9HYPH
MSNTQSKTREVSLDPSPHSLPRLKVQSRKIKSLKPYSNNARKHSKKQIHQIAESIKAFGFSVPILIDEDDVLIAGHGRLEAAKRLNFDAVPTIRLDHLDDAQKRAFILADNRLAENASWDEQALSVEFQSLVEFNADVPLTITGFDVPEIDSLLEFSPVDETGDAETETAEIDTEAPAVSRPGDLWELGPHRLLCGDARDPRAYLRLLGGQKARMVITDPPFNVRINGHVGGLGRVKHREFPMASGEMSEEQFTNFLTEVFSNLTAHSVDGSIHYVFADWRHLYEYLSAGRSAYTEQKNLAVWAKHNAGMGSFYRAQHELVMIFKSGSSSHINNFDLGQHGRHRTNVWNYAGVNGFRKGRDDDLSLHPTVRPVPLIADAILDCSEPGDMILDCFCGSGTVFLAAHRTGRKAFAIELDPRYVDVAVRRWQKQTGEQAMHSEKQVAFDVVSNHVGEEVSHVE